MPLDGKELISFVQVFGVPVSLLLWLVFALVRGDIVPGYLYRQVVAQLSEAIGVAKGIKETTDRALDLLEARGKGS